MYELLNQRNKILPVTIAIVINILNMMAYKNNTFIFITVLFNWMSYKIMSIKGDPQEGKPRMVENVKWISCIRGLNMVIHNRFHSKMQLFRKVVISN